MHVSWASAGIGTEDRFGFLIERRWRIFVNDPNIHYYAANLFATINRYDPRCWNVLFLNQKAPRQG
jgi:hypothetical protein